MSHKIVISSAFDDKAALERALQDNGWGYEVRGKNVLIEDGPGAGGTVDLTTGAFAGDSDFHSESALGPLTQAYGEALWKNRVSETGGYVESREVLSDGTIRLIATVSGV